MCLNNINLYAVTKPTNFNIKLFPILLGILTKYYLNDDTPKFKEKSIIFVFLHDILRLIAVLLRI